MKRFVPVLIAAAAGFVAGSAPRVNLRAAEYAQSIVKAQAFELVSQTGSKRGELMLDANGNPVLRLYDARGRVIWEAPAVRPIPVR